MRDLKGQAVVLARLRRLARGHHGDAKSVGDGVNELRIHFGPGYRVYFTRRGAEIIFLLSGGDKGSQQSDIARAKRIAATISAEESWH